MIKVKSAYDKTYNEDEIRELLAIYKSGNKEEYKNKSEAIAPKLYNLGSTFGRESVGIMSKMLADY